MIWQNARFDLLKKTSWSFIMLFSWCPPLNMSLGKVPVSAFWDVGFADNHRRQGYCFMLNIDFAYASSNDNAKFHFLISSSLTFIILTAFKSKVADDGISKKREVSFIFMMILIFYQLKMQRSEVLIWIFCWTLLAGRSGRLIHLTKLRNHPYDAENRSLLLQSAS